MDFEISIGTYPGIVLGFRTYPGVDKSGKDLNSHVLYLPFISIAIEFNNAEDETNR